MDSFSLISKSAENVIRKENKRAQRRAKREHVIKLAEYLHQDEKEMLTLWLADKVLDAVGDKSPLISDIPTSPVILK